MLQCPPASNWSIQTLISGGDSRCSWVFICALGPSEWGWGDSAYGLRHSSGGGPYQTPVSCQEQRISISGEVLTLVEEYKQLVSAQPLLMLLKTEERSLL